MVPTSCLLRLRRQRGSSHRRGCMGSCRLCSLCVHRQALVQFAKPLGMIHSMYTPTRELAAYERTRTHTHTDTHTHAHVHAHMLPETVFSNASSCKGVEARRAMKGFGTGLHRCARTRQVSATSPRMMLARASMQAYTCECY